MVIAQRLFAGVGKTKKANGLKYDYLAVANVSSESIRALNLVNISTHLTKAEYSHEGNRTHADITRRFVNSDNPEEYFDVPSFGDGIDNQDKGAGKALSYADKNLLIRQFFIGGDDVEADQTTTFKPDAPADKTELAVFTKWMTAQKIAKADMEKWLMAGKYKCGVAELSSKRIDILMKIETLAELVKK